MTVELTEDEWKIPELVASELECRNTELWQELVSEGNLAVIEAAMKFDNRKKDRSGFLYRAAMASALKLMPYRQKVRGGPKYKVKILSLDYAVSDSVPLAELVAEKVRTVNDTAEFELRRLMSKLKPLERAAYLLLERDGLGVREAATRMGLSYHVVTQLRKTAVNRLKNVAAKANRRHTRNNLRNRRTVISAAQKKAAARHCRDMAAARRALGEIPHGRWQNYVVYDEGKVLYGPSKSLARLMTDLAIPHKQKKLHAKSAAPMLGLWGLRWVRGKDVLLLSRAGYKLVKPGPLARSRGGWLYVKSLTV